MTASLIGYARRGRFDTPRYLEAQQSALTDAGCDRVIVEIHSGRTTRPRKRLEEALASVSEGDVVMATKLDRLARSPTDLMRIVARLQSRKAALILLDVGGEPMDTRTAAGMRVIKTLAAVAEFERALVYERQREGIALAQEAGLYQRRKVMPHRHTEAIQKLRGEGVAVAEIVKRLDVSRATVYRILAEDRAAAEVT